YLFRYAIVDAPRRARRQIGPMAIRIHPEMASRRARCGDAHRLRRLGLVPSRDCGAATERWEGGSVRVVRGRAITLAARTGPAGPTPGRSGPRARVRAREQRGLRTPARASVRRGVATLAHRGVATPRDRWSLGEGPRRGRAR